MAESVVDLDPAASVEELAAAIVALPDGTDLGSDCVGELGRVLLTGRPEERDPLKYAAIFDAVRRSDGASRWMTYAAGAQSINGRRRAKGASMTAIAEEIAKLGNEAADNLPSSPHKYALLGDVCYNAGIINRGLRRYSDEERVQRESAGWYNLAGAFAKADTNLFCAQVGAGSAAFDSGDSGAIPNACYALADLRTFVKGKHDPYPTWMHENAPIHIGWAFIMGYISGIFVEDDLEDLDEDFRAGASSRFAQWKRVFETWDRYERGDYDGVIATDPVDAPSSSLDNATLTIRILSALAKGKKGDKEGERAALEDVAAHKGADGGIPIAVAKKLLAS